MIALGSALQNRWAVSAGHADLVRPLRPARAVRVEVMPKAVTLDLARSAIVVIDM